MPNDDFNSMIDKYKQEMINMSKQSLQPTNMQNGEDIQAIENNLDASNLQDEESAQETYEEFLTNNSKSGILKIQVFTADQAIPIKNADVIISKNFKDETKVFYTVQTDISGIADGIILPAPDKIISESPSNKIPYTTYDVTATHPNFEDAKYFQTYIFDGIKSIQPIKMIPKENNNV